MIRLILTVLTVWGCLSLLCAPLVWALCVMARRSDDMAVTMAIPREGEPIP